MASFVDAIADLKPYLSLFADSAHGCRLQLVALDQIVPLPNIDVLAPIVAVRKLLHAGVDSLLGHVAAVLHVFFRTYALQRAQMFYLNPQL